MFGYDRINELYLLESANNYELPTWVRADRLDNCEGFLQRCFNLFRIAK